MAVAIPGVMIYLEMSPFQILKFEVCVCVGGFFVLVTCKISKDFDAANYEKVLRKPYPSIKHVKFYSSTMF